jgi:hypothetical protein
MYLVNERPKKPMALFTVYLRGATYLGKPQFTGLLEGMGLQTLLRAAPG